MPITPHSGLLSASADVRGRGISIFVGISLVFPPFFVYVVATRCAFYVLFSIFAVRWSVVCGSIVRALFRRCVKEHV